MIANVLAAFAILVSFYAVFQTRKFHKEQLNLIDRQTEFTRIMTEKEGKEFSGKRKAQVSARLYLVSKNSWKLRVFNTGPAEARDVKIILDDQNSMIQSGMIAQKFPMRKMENGQSVDVHAAVYMGTPSKEAVTLKWDDDSKIGREY